MSDGRRGSEPPWHRTLVAARLAGAAPWEMDAQSLYWQERVIAARAVEAEVERRRAGVRARPGGRRR